MTERTPKGGEFTFSYGRIASPENLVRINGGVQATELEAEYTIGFNSQGWGEPAVFLCDQQGALLTRQLLVPASGIPVTAFPVDISDPDIVLDAAPQLAPINASVIYGYTGTNAPTIETSFEQLRVLNSNNNPTSQPNNHGTLATASPLQWTLRNTAAAGAQATATRAAGGAGTRHVVQSADFNLSGAAASIFDLTCRIRDGVAGTILWEAGITKGLTQNSVHISFDRRGIFLSANTILEVDFSAAPGDPLLIESFNVYGITVDDAV